MLAATPASYYVARHRFPGRSAFLFVVLVTQMFSPTALVVGLYREFFELGLVNTYAALILTNAAFNLAFAIWILRAFFASIPREIEEAAAVDGCGRIRTLLQVVLPLSLPGLVTAVVFAFIAAWNEYIVALTLMSDPDQQAADRRASRPTSPPTCSTGTSSSRPRSSPSSRWSCSSR